MELLFILYKSFIRLLSSKAVKNHAKLKMSQFLEIFSFLERLKDSTQSIHNCMKTFDVRHEAKQYKVSRGIVAMENAFFSASFPF